MEIVLRHLEIRNFKGIKSLSVPFGVENTAICGANATGKTSVFDAFVWLMFGKDSKNTAAFNIKTLDENGIAIPKQEHEVEGILEVNGMPIKFKRTYREKWVTRRANAQEVMDGHETTYTIDDVPVQAGEYQRRVSQILNEDTFRMVTDPLYFNSKNWKERRKVLIEMAGELNDTEILNSDPVFRPLVEQMGSKSIEEFKAVIHAKKQPIDKILKEIPARIDEVDRSMPEAEDWEELRKQADTIRTEIKNIDAAIIDRSKPIEAFYKEQSKRQERIHKLDEQIRQITYDAKLRQQTENNDLSALRRKLEGDIGKLQQEIYDLKKRIEDYDRVISQAEERRQDYLKQWHSVDAEQFEIPAGSFICPTCSREFDADVISEKEDEMRRNFTNDKTRRLNAIQENGRKQKGIVEDTEQTKADAGKRIESLEKELDKLRLEHSELPEPSTKPTVTAEELTEIASLQQERDTLKEEQPKAPTIDVSDLQERKQEQQNELDKITMRLAKAERIDELDARKSQLLDEQKTQAEAKAELQKLELLIMEFTKTKMALVDERVNGKFKYVTFRMFDTQINGGEVECCDAMIGGVPYEDANNAAKINAGIDIINALCEFYGVTAPIFIDNRESVNTLIYTPSQLISLIVTENKTLQIN